MKSALRQSINFASIQRRTETLLYTRIKDAAHRQRFMKNDLNVVRRVSNAASVDGNRFLAKLDPMKRILCLCPVPISSCNEDTKQKRDTSTPIQTWSKSDKFHMNIGFAVSDPYLGYAIPVQTDKFTPLISIDANGKVSFQSFPESIEHLSECIDYHDIGSVIIGLPLYNGQDDMNKDIAKMQKVQHVLHQELETIISKQESRTELTHSRINDVLSIHDRSSYTKVLEMAIEEPEMWEEIAKKMNGVIEPEVHAAAVLNVFLWNHTGGWRNTFA
ncbi:hypothetical protein CTEN210_16391 [Chaetoceros tenuissimus]|uniref:Uncharacterized protein n=1 Tax=Chaetoceros tenuissimus TaxID=426638 RepID=A0AAD3HDS2_9STRA|nr:hypothetical protein CTEN210_16391 [Chaetoceros tenuissimus]